MEILSSIQLLRLCECLWDEKSITESQFTFTSLRRLEMYYKPGDRLNCVLDYVIRRAPYLRELYFKGEYYGEKRQKVIIQSEALRLLDARYLYRVS